LNSSLETSRAIGCYNPEAFMNTTKRMNKNIFKSIGAILAGMVAGAVLSVVTDLVLEKTGVFPPPKPGLFAGWMLSLALVYRSIYTILSGYVAAALSPNKSMHHAVILGAIGVVITILGSVANWDKSAAWYPVALIVVTLPCTWLGGFLFERSGTDQ
jgi:hypothetical protein